MSNRLDQHNPNQRGAEPFQQSGMGNASVSKDSEGNDSFKDALEMQSTDLDTQLAVT